jgi:hypothetical protein
VTIRINVAMRTLDGRKFAGEVLVVMRQGIGDTIHRLAPSLMLDWSSDGGERAATVIAALTVLFFATRSPRLGAHQPRTPTPTRSARSAL